MPDSAYKRKYLVLYDTVPGGTGYLKQLMQAENQLMDVLEMSLEALRSCACNQDAEKDGCYRCLFAYRSSYNMPETSRETAVALLAEILSFREKLVKTENISDIPINTFIESELETRFLGALKLYRSPALPLLLKNDLVNGKPGYFFKVGDRAYYIEPQVELGELSGVSVSSRADFLIKSARFNDGIKPVAVFLDGFTYHHHRIGLDMAQRMAIVQSGKYHVWSLSWHDVENKFKCQKSFFEDYMDPAGLPSGSNFKPLLEGYGLGRFKNHIKYISLDALMHFLENPDEEKWRRFMFVSALVHVDPKRYGDGDAVRKWMDKVVTLMPEAMAEKMKESDGPGLSGSCLYGYYDSSSQGGDRFLKQFVVVEKKAVTPPGEPSGVSVGCHFDDEKTNKDKPGFQSGWNGFLRLYNFYQFLPHAYFVTSEGNKAKAYDTIKLFEEPDAGITGVKDVAAVDIWDAIKEMTDDRFHNLLALLRDNGWPVPEAGYELAGDTGEIMACAELGWGALKIAFLADQEIEYQPQFAALGWKTALISEVLSDAQRFMSMKDMLL